MLRIILFLATNLAIMLVASITLNLLGVTTILAQNGVDLNLPALLIFCGVFGMMGSFISLMLSKPMAKWSTRAQIIKTPQTSEEVWLVSTVQELARTAGIGMPEVGVFPVQQANAFATGMFKNSALVAISQGMLDRYSREEVKAVLAHEISHVANGDMVTLALIQGVVNTFVMFFARIIGFVVDRVVFKTERGQGPAFYIATIFAEIVLGILASMIVFWFSRRREYRADAGSAKLSGSRPMIDALSHLKAEQEVPNQLPETLYAFGINQGLRQGFTRLFATHPPLEERIKALETISI